MDTLRFSNKKGKLSTAAEIRANMQKVKIMLQDNAAVYRTQEANTICWQDKTLIDETVQ